MAKRNRNKHSGTERRRIFKDAPVGQRQAPLPSEVLPRPWMRCFLAAFARTGHVAYACDEADVSRAAPYAARKVHPIFGQLWDELKARGLDDALLAARQRGVDGWDEPLHKDGKLTGDAVRKYDNRLLVRYLEAYDEDWNRSRGAQQHGADDPRDFAQQLRDAMAGMSGTVPGSKEEQDAKWDEGANPPEEGATGAARYFGGPPRGELPAIALPAPALCVACGSTILHGLCPECPSPPPV